MYKVAETEMVWQGGSTITFGRGEIYISSEVEQSNWLQMC